MVIAKNILEDDRDEKYWNYIRNESKRVHAKPPWMFGDCKITMHDPDSYHRNRMTEYFGVPIEDHTHHILFRLENGLPLVVNKVDLYTGYAKVEVIDRQLNVNI